MLRLVLLLLYLAASFSWIGGGWDPDGQPAPTADSGQNLDPDG